MRSAIVIFAILLGGCGAGQQQAFLRTAAECVLSLADSSVESLAESHEAIRPEVEVAQSGIEAGQLALEAWATAESDDPIPEWIAWAREAIGWVGRLINALQGVGVPIPEWLDSLADIAQGVAPEDAACPIE